MLKWNPYRNPPRASFIVEARTGAGGWAYVQETASRNKRTREPCAPVTRWPASAAPSLRLAA